MVAKQHVSLLRIPAVKPGRSNTTLDAGKANCPLCLGGRCFGLVASSARPAFVRPGELLHHAN